MRSRCLKKQSLWRLSPLCVSRYTAGNMTVTCVLYRVAPRRARRADPSASPDALFAIGMEGGGDRSLCLVGQDETRARQLVRDAARLTVTPCTLRDIVEDMEYCG